MAVKPKGNFDYEKDEKRGRPRRNAAWAMSNSNNQRSKAVGGGLHTRIEAAYRGKLVGKMIASDTGQFDRETTQLTIKNQIARGKSMRARSEKIFPKNSQTTAEGQRKAYQRDGRLGTATGTEMSKAKPKPKYQPASPPRYPDAPGGNNNSGKKPSDYNKSPRSNNTNPDKAYSSGNPAKNRPYPGTVGQVGKALEKAYEGGQARGARLAGAKTTSIKGRIPVVRRVRQSTISPVTGKKIKPTSGGAPGGRGGQGVGRYGGGGGGLRISGRKGFGEQ